MDIYIQLIINALQTGAVYVIFALGLTLIFGVMKIVNFAHGEFYTIGGFITYLMLGQTNLINITGNKYLSYFLTFIIAIIIVGVLGYFVEMLVFKRFRSDMTSGLIVSLGLSMVLQVILLILFGGSAKNVPSIFTGKINVMGSVLSNERIAVMLIAICLTTVLYLFIKKSKFGKAMRAVSQDQEAAELQGINYNFVSRWGFVLGAVLAATAGVLVTPISVIEPSIGGAYLMKAFIIIILGGMGSIPGSILAGFILGGIESVGVFFFNTQFATMLSFGLLILMLLIKPQGMMGK